MKKVFWEDPYRTELSTRVAAVKENIVLLEETIAFSFSGGQESDRATINRLPVSGSFMEGPLIFYQMEEGHGLKAGDSVTLQIDWPRRFRLMRLHFAAELILEIITRKYGLEKIGAHISETKARIDFIYEGTISSFFDPILKEYLEIIRQDLPIRTGYSDEKMQRRYWEIEGFAKVPCGGTHVKSTAEVGEVILKRVNPGGSKERIEIRLVQD